MEMGEKSVELPREFLITIVLIVIGGVWKKHEVFFVFFYLILHSVKGSITDL